MRHDQADWPTDPYPEQWEEISDVRYRSALSLIRPLNVVLERLGEDGDYILQHDFNVDYTLDGTETRRITVPRGLITDLTSVPRILRIFVGRVGPWLEAAILHDYLYVAWQDVPGREPRPEDRLFADRMMLRAMEAADVNWLTQWAIYLVLRAFGWRAFRRRNLRRYAELDTPSLEGALAFRLPSRRSKSPSELT